MDRPRALGLLLALLTLCITAGEWGPERGRGHGDGAETQAWVLAPVPISHRDS